MDLGPQYIPSPPPTRTPESACAITVSGIAMSVGGGMLVQQCQGHLDDWATVGAGLPAAGSAIGGGEVEEAGCTIGVQGLDVRLELHLTHDDIIDEAHAMQLHDEIGQPPRNNALVLLTNITHR